MILEIIHPTRGTIGTVELKNGVVIKTSGTASSREQSPVRQMKGWIEASVREYSKSMNWIVTNKNESPDRV